MKIAHLLFFILFLTSIHSQTEEITDSNFIPNAGFESLDLRFKSGLAEKAMGWFSGTKGKYSTPDHHRRQGASDKKEIITKFGKIEAFKGVCVAGFLNWKYDPKRKAHREYICTKLNKKLEKGKKYKASIQFQFAQKGKYYCPEFGMAFVRSIPEVFHNNELKEVQPQIQNLLVDSNTRYQWQKLEGVFTANGGEEYVIIGNFKNQRNSLKYDIEVDSSVRFPGEYSYIFIDNLSTNPYIDHRIVQKKLPGIGQSFQLPNIHFNSDEALLTKSSQNTLKKTATLFSDYPNLKVEIQGHTDSTASDQHNIILSERRANAIRNYLIQEGISQNRLTAKGFGSNKPIDTNKTESGKAKNRRVEFLVIDK